MAKAKTITSGDSPEQRFAALATATAPQWGETILRLTEATDRLAVQFDRFIGADTKINTVSACRQLAQELISFLDEIGDTDQDCAVDDNPCDNDFDDEQSEVDEPSLGWTAAETACEYYSVGDNREEDAGDEPECDPAESGLGDLDGLLEQTCSRSSYTMGGVE
jgi:hypothetical protein